MSCRLLSITLCTCAFHNLSAILIMLIINKRAEEQVEAEYIFLYRCMGNTSSDAEDLTENQLNPRSLWPLSKKGIYRATQNPVGWRKEGTKNESEWTWGARGWGGVQWWGVKQGWDPCTQDNLLGQKGSIWDCQRAKQPICDSLKGVRAIQTVWAMARHIPDRNASPSECRQPRR